MLILVPSKLLLEQWAEEVRRRVPGCCPVIGWLWSLEMAQREAEGSYKLR